MEEVKTPKPRRVKLTPQECEVIERLSAAGRTAIDIAAVTGRCATTINGHLMRAGLRQPAPKPAFTPPKKYEVVVKGIPKPIFQLICDASVRRKITPAEAMLRCAEYIFLRGSPSKALDAVEFRHTLND
jgi:hypothetical protein